MLTGQVDLIEAPAPDAVASIRARGFKIATSQSSHVWPWLPSMLDGSPWQGKRVREAAHLCSDRNDLVVLNGGLADPAFGMMRPNHPWFGKPGLKLRFDGDEGRKLMKAAGYSEQKRATVKILTTTVGSAMMQPLPMNETLQQALAKCYFDAEARDAALAKVHERLVDESMFIYMVHEVAPRALSPRIKDFSAPNGFYVDWSRIDMASD